MYNESIISMIISWSISLKTFPNSVYYRSSDEILKIHYIESHLSLKKIAKI